MSDFLNKITSRKFLISLAAFLGSLGVSISGIVTSSQTVTAIGIICATLSAAIYSALEASVDKTSLLATYDEDETIDYDDDANELDES